MFRVFKKKGNNKEMERTLHVVALYRAVCTVCKEKPSLEDLSFQRVQELYTRLGEDVPGIRVYDFSSRPALLCAWNLLRVAGTSLPEHLRNQGTIKTEELCLARAKQILLAVRKEADFSAVPLVLPEGMAAEDAAAAVVAFLPGMVPRGDRRSQPCALGKRCAQQRPRRAGRPSKLPSCFAKGAQGAEGPCPVCLGVAAFGGGHAAGANGHPRDSEEEPPHKRRKVERCPFFFSSIHFDSAFCAGATAKGVWLPDRRERMCSLQAAAGRDL